jgi:ATP-dependent exoDNAse (exonuclease V) beta subunit
MIQISVSFAHTLISVESKMSKQIENIALVSAAGAGKTRALTRRFLYLYLHKAQFPLGSLYGITFTNEAAFEMKMRILRYLELLASGYAKDESEEDILRYFHEIFPDCKERAEKKKRFLLSNLSDLNISTFHSLFASFLSSIPFAAGILPGYEIIDEIQEELLFEATLDIFFERVHQDITLYNTISDVLEQQETRLKNNIKNIFWSVSPWLEYLRDLVDNEKSIKQHVTEHENRFLQTLKRFRDFIRENELFTYTKNEQKMNKYFANFLTKVDCFLKTQELKIIENTLFGVDITGKNYMKIFLKNLGEQANEFTKIIDELKNIEMQYVQLLSDHQILIHLKPILELYEQFQKAKQDKNLLTFTDIETYTLRALINNPEPEYLYFKLGADINHLMIDEFQDTSYRQLEILDPLIAEITSTAPSEKSFFYVGDPRQAIFRWRGGTPELFKLLKMRYGDKIKEDELKINYRSKEEIINFVNTILEKNDQAKQGNTGGWIRVENLGEYNTTNEGNDKILGRTTHIIEDLHDNFGYAYSDIAILVRTNNFGAMVAETLTRKHIPCVSKSRADILSNNDIRFVINLLKFLDNPENDFALMHVLLSPVFKIKEETLRRLRFGNKTLYMSLIDNHSEWNATKKLEHLLRIVHFCNPYELIYRIYRELRLTISYSLATLLDVALEYTKRGFTHLSIFIDWLEKAGSSIDVKESHPEGIKVLTVHKAKGLEFEVVIIPETNWQLRRPENKQLIFSYRENGAAPDKIYWRNYGKYFKHLLEEERERLKKDALNLLYVALTRAKNGVYILGFDSPKIGYGFWMDRIADVLKNMSYSIGDIIQKEKLVKKEEKYEHPMVISEKPMIIKEERSLYSPTERGVEIIEPQRRRGMEFGEIVHNALSKIAWLDECVIEDYINELVNNIKNIYVRSPEDASIIEAKLTPLLRETVSDPDLRFFFYRDNRDIRCKNELPIYFEDEKRDVSAHIDRLLIEQNRITIVDYKTGEEKPEYKHQMRIYKKGIQKIYPDKLVKTFLIYLENKHGRKTVEV